MANSYGLKVIQSGKIVEIYEYKNPVFYGYSDSKKSCGLKGRQVVANLDDKEKNREQVLSRARRNLRRIVNSNIQENSKFLTLTFKDNLQDLEQANKYFMLFIKRLSYYLSFKVQYSCVVEFQKRGAIHYHVILYNCSKKLKVKDIECIWGHGFIKINRITNVDNVGAYICKYMTKCEDEKKLRGKKIYFNSRGLKKPREIKEPGIVKTICDSLKYQVPSYEKTFENEYNSINYKQYILTD